MRNSPHHQELCLLDANNNENYNTKDHINNYNTDDEIS